MTDTATAATTKIRKPRTPRPALDLTTMDASIVKPAVVAERKRTRNVSLKERKAQQKAVDGLVQKAYDAWVKAGSPTAWADQPGGHVILPMPQLETLKSAVYAAGQYLDLRVRFGSINEVDRDGQPYADVVFVATDKPADKADESESAEGSEG